MAKSDRRPALGRGLSALIPDKPAAPAPAQEGWRDAPYEVDLDLLEPNPRQPRLSFDDAALDELAASIRVHGLVQPIVVRRKDRRFEIVAGERRWRAAQRAGLLKVPVVVRDVPDDKLLQVALIENIQRENLNAIDEALAYQQLTRDLGLTQEEVAGAVGKDRASIANYLRLLKLPEPVRKEVAAGRLSMGHARALLALDDPPAITSAAETVQRKALSVRETEALVKKLQQADAADASEPPPKDVHTREAEERLRVALGTRVAIKRKRRGGRIEIEFVNEDELIRIFDALVSR
jgi:ParB family chromosome partitioning protein